MYEKGYLVIGSCGEYDGYTEWAVAFFTDQTEAGLWAIEAEKKAKELKGKMGLPFGCNPYDPDNDFFYSGTTYSIMPIPFNPVRNKNE